jgi:lysophospholipase L1-like esterase
MSAHSFAVALAAGCWLTVALTLQAASPVQTPDGRIRFPADAATLSGAGVSPSTTTGSPPAFVMPPSRPVSARWDFKPTRWGRYDLTLTYAAATTPGVLQVEVAGQAFDLAPASTGGNDRFVEKTLTRLYLPKSDPFSVELRGTGADRAAELRVQSLSLVPAPEGEAITQSPDGRITLHSRDATTHSVMMRYEPATNKNCLGYWVNPADWADWTFTVTRPGTFDVVVWQGCGTGQGGSDVAVEAGGDRLPFVVEETGHFQNFVPRHVGRVTLQTPGTHTLAIKPQKKKAGAVMDIRTLQLVPAQTQRDPSPAARDWVGARRIVVLGDSITYAGGWVEFVEAWLHLQYPDARLEILNLGLPSETVSGLSEPGHAGGSFPRPGVLERLGRVLEKAKPDLIVACYGMNDGIYYPLGDERFQKFQGGIRQLRDRAAKAGVRVIHVTPPVFDPLPLAGRTLPAGREAYPSPYEGYNTVLDRYSEWLLSQRAQGWDVISAHEPMNQYLAAKRRTDPQFILAGDGVHANPQGHWIIAREVLRHLGSPDASLNTDSPDAFFAADPRGTEVLALVRQRQGVLKDAWLTAVGHQRPGMNPGKPLAEAQREAEALTAKLKSAP